MKKRSRQRCRAVLPCKFCRAYLKPNGPNASYETVRQFRKYLLKKPLQILWQYFWTRAKPIAKGDVGGLDRPCCFEKLLSDWLVTKYASGERIYLNCDVVIAIGFLRRNLRNHLERRTVRIYDLLNLWDLSTRRYSESPESFVSSIFRNSWIFRVPTVLWKNVERRIGNGDRISLFLRFIAFVHTV